MNGPKERPQYAELAPIAGAGPIGAIIFGVIAVAQLVASIFGLFTGGSGASTADLNKLRNDTAAALDTTYRFAWKSLFALGGLLKALDWIWSNVVKRLLSQFVQMVKQLYNLITRVITPMLNALHRIREILNELYDKYLRPLLNIIQKVRRYLQILRALHVPFADKLDGILSRVQAKIIGPYLWVLSTLNGYGRWINLIITAQATIQRPIFIRTMYAHQADWVNMFWSGQQSPSVGSPPSPAKAVTPTPDAHQVASDFGNLARSDSGPYAKAATDSAGAFRAIVGL